MLLLEFFLSHLFNLLSNNYQELSRLRQWIDDDPRLFTAEIILALLMSYRDIQAYNNMVDLVEKLPTHDQVRY